MNYTTIRVYDSTHKMIKNLAKTSNLSLHSIVEKSLKFYADNFFWDGCQKAYSALIKDKQKWQEELDERNL